MNLNILKQTSKENIGLKWDSNQRPLGYKSSALLSELSGPMMGPIPFNQYLELKILLGLKCILAHCMARILYKKMVPDLVKSGTF